MGTRYGCQLRVLVRADTRESRRSKGLGRWSDRVQQAHAAHFARLEMCVERFLLRFGSESTGADESSEVSRCGDKSAESFTRSLRANGKYSMYTILEGPMYNEAVRDGQHSIRVNFSSMGEGKSR